ncbi:triose-phosphate isomerase [Candidatus Syntrophosphaera thermopropionivorans]|uniref:Triose-phosphate isomerase n=1 Tax=Candidatus Syntrophosphaera thermopropionivorans TaxID=2593015 RepID=A0AC61QJP8_9BACT|nr:triose-phosphate isomerase [Candidatus Syntrophosphaera thermopropionivorans]TDF73405.1 triose-phosphate isomerase [Candidatus Syntrophosphaera thermopropionivorans]
MRQLIIAGNWKMHKDAQSTEDFCNALAQYLVTHKQMRVLPLIAPAYPFLEKALKILNGLPVEVAAQDVSYHLEGAYTGEVSANQLSSLGLHYCIVGHSERRQYHSETDAMVRDKQLRLREQSMIPIVCLGETLSQRQAGKTQEVILSQLNGCFEGIELQTGKDVIIAYEPVWAIGTGLTATANQAQEAHLLIRNWLKEHYSEEIAQNVHILYGGSIKPENIYGLISEPDIDGGLIGGASLKIEDFCKMIDIAVDLINSGSK